MSAKLNFKPQWALMESLRISVKILAITPVDVCQRSVSFPNQLGKFGGSYCNIN